MASPTISPDYRAFALLLVIQEGRGAPRGSVGSMACEAKQPYLQTQRFAEVQAALLSCELQAAVDRSTPWRQRVPRSNLREYSHSSQSAETLPVTSLCLIKLHAMTTYWPVQI
jgi:hypothetical protein